MLLNVVFRLVPIVLTAAMMATEMPAAIRPYSMAVAPLSSFRKRRTSFFMAGFPWWLTFWTTMLCLNFPKCKSDR